MPVKDLISRSTIRHIAASLLLIGLSSQSHAQIAKSCSDFFSTTSTPEAMKLFSGLASSVLRGNPETLPRLGARIGTFFPREISLRQGNNKHLLLNVGLTDVVDLSAFTEIDASRINFSDPVSTVFKNGPIERRIVAAQEPLSPDNSEQIMLAIWSLDSQSQPLHLLLQIVNLKADGSIDFSKPAAQAARYSSPKLHGSNNQTGILAWRKEMSQAGLSNGQISHLLSESQGAQSSINQRIRQLNAAHMKADESDPTLAHLIAHRDAARAKLQENYRGIIQSMAQSLAARGPGQGPFFFEGKDYLLTSIREMQFNQHHPKRFEFVFADKDDAYSQRTFNQWDLPGHLVEDIFIHLNNRD